MDQQGTPLAQDDQFSSDVNEAAGDIDLNVLENDMVLLEDGTTEDYFGNVLTVNGAASNLGTWVDGSNGGRFTLNADGSLDFDASTIDFNDPLLIFNADGSLTTTVTYTIGTFTNEEICVVVPYMPPSCILTEDVWFGSILSGPCIDSSVDGVNTIEWDYHKGDDRLSFKLKIDNDKALFGDNSENAEVLSADLSDIEQTLTDLGAHTIELNKFNFTDKGLEIEIKGYGIDFLNGSDDDDLIEQFMNQLLGDEVVIPLTIEENGDQSIVHQAFCIEKFDSHSPIAFDLTGDGKIGTTGVSTAQNRIDSVIGATVMFDIDADGTLDEIEWMDGAGDGLLFDATGFSVGVDTADGANLFGDQGGLYANGYVKLAGRDADGNGRIEGAELDGLEMWVDDGDAVVEAGELQSLNNYGVQSISVEYREVLNERGEVLIRSEAKIGDGSTGLESVTELETCENAMVCFDFQTTAKLLTEDVWFAAPPSGPCIDESVEGYDAVEWDYHKGDDRLMFKLKFKDEALFGEDNDVQITNVDMSAVEQVMLALGATSIVVDKHHITDTDIEIILFGHGVDLGDIETSDFELLVPAEVPFEISGIDGANEPIDITPIFCVDKIKSHSPIAFDLNGDGQIGVTGVSTAQDRIDGLIGATVEFDIDADGDLDEIEWMNGDGDGLLVDNRDGNAAADMDGARLFGDQGGLFANGYEKLALLDLDGDGHVEGAELAGLEVWIDDGDAVVQAGELVSLDSVGISSVATGFERVLNDRGEVLMQSTAMVDAEAAGRVTYALSGLDAALFTLDVATGELAFINPPDHETPLDANGDNIYEVTVERTLDGVTSSEAVEITVKDCDDEATVSVTIAPPAPSSIAGRYWCDEDGDNLETPGEEGIQEAQVTLERWDASAMDWVFVDETFTSSTAGSEGEYVFTDLDADNYRVIFSEASGKDFVTANVGQTGTEDVADDSDVVTILADGRGATAAIELAAGQDLTDVDAGAAEPIQESSVDALNDVYVFSLFDMVLDETTGIWSYTFPDPSQETILFNDSDPDGDAFSISGVEGQAPDATGSFADVVTSNIGTVVVDSDGSFDFRLTMDEYDAIEIDDGMTPELTFTTFEYEITDDSPAAATDTAEVTILIELLEMD